jgi:hypothetical protein
MKEDRVDELLNELSRRVTEPIRPGLGEEIKQRIPHRLSRHKIGWDTVNIIIDLRLSRSVAAAVIIVAILLFLNLFGSRDASGGLFQDGVLLLRYWGGAARSNVSTGKAKYEHLLHRGEDVTWYGDWIDPADSNAVLMHQKLPARKYMVTFVDGRENEVDSEELIELLSRTLQKKPK